MLHRIADRIAPEGRMFAAENWHIHFKRTLIGFEELPMPDGTVAQKEPTTTELSVEEFGDYMTQVEVFAHEHGVWLDE